MFSNGFFKVVKCLDCVGKVQRYFLFPVVNAREGVYDSMAMSLIASMGRLKAQNLHTEFVRFQATEFAEKLVSSWFNFCFKNQSQTRGNQSLINSNTEVRSSVSTMSDLRTGGRCVQSPARLIFFPRIDDIHSSLAAVHCFDNGYVGKQPMACKEYCAEYW